MVLTRMTDEYSIRLCPTTTKIAGCGYESVSKSKDLQVALSADLSSEHQGFDYPWVLTSVVAAAAGADAVGAAGVGPAEASDCGIPVDICGVASYAGAGASSPFAPIPSTVCVLS